MNRTFDLDDVYRKISCFSVMTVNHKDRCEFVKRAKDCTYIMNLFRYYVIMYCGMKVDDRGSELLVILLYAVIIFFQMLWLQLLIEKYLCQIVKIIIIKLKLNEYLAGITLVAFCNSVPEMMANLMPIRSMSPIYSITMSAGLSVTLLAGGTICYLRSFQINKACALRDILCLILVSEITLYFILLNGCTTLAEACVFITTYTVYLVINIIDLKLSRKYIKKLKEKIAQMKTKDLTIRDHEKLSGLETTLTSLEADDVLVLHNYRNTYYYDNMIRKSVARRSTYRRSTIGRSSRVIPREAGIDMASTRDILHNPENPKNMFIFSEFRHAIWPVDREKWRITGWCGRGLLILIAPLYFFSVILIPNPDYTADKHGWSKLLNCFHMIISPFFCTLIIHSMYLNKYDEYTMHFEYNIAIYSFGITVPLAIAMLIHARTDKPPPYHFIFAILGFTTTTLSLMLCVTEMKVLFSIIGLAFDLSEDYVEVNLCVLATSVIDVVVNSSFAKQGYERMAFAASLASPIFEMSFCMGLICLVNARVQEIGSTTWMIGVHGYITRVFFLIAVVSYLAWGLTYNFFTRRSIGIYSYIIYALFCLYLLLAEFDVIYDITFLTPYIKPQ